MYWDYLGSAIPLKTRYGNSPRTKEPQIELLYCPFASQMAMNKSEQEEIYVGKFFLLSSNVPFGDKSIFSIFDKQLKYSESVCSSIWN